MTNQNTTTSNQELLSWAVENIKEWNDDYTHLRSDDSRHSLFFSYGDFIKDGDGTWCWDSRNGDVWDVSVIYDKSFCTKPAQVITKEEWLEGVALLKHYDDGLVMDAPTSSSEPLTGHVHAELMAEYALVAKTNPKPWKEFEFKDPGSVNWIGCSNGTMLFQNWREYRRKPTPLKTMNIGGIVVEAWPLEKAEIWGNYFEVLQHYGEFMVNKLQPWKWADGTFYDRVLKAGYIFATEEQAQAVADALNLVYNRALGKVE